MPWSPPVHMTQAEQVAALREGQARRDSHRLYNKNRVSDDAFYGSVKWKRVRAWWRKHHPLCKRCESRGITQAVEVVDHIIPRKQGGASTTPTNLQSLCNTCHAEKTAEDIIKYRGRAGKK